MMRMTLDDGSIIDYEVVTSFYLAATHKNYIVYTDGKYVNDKLNIFSVSYGDDKDNIDYVIDNDEWQLIVDKMKEIGFEGV